MANTTTSFNVSLKHGFQLGCHIFSPQETFLDVLTSLCKGSLPGHPVLFSILAVTSVSLPMFFYIAAINIIHRNSSQDIRTTV